eukprot:NODE_2038_length_1708_cov_55.051104_g1743_i0.p1 GENE.NODE_2038_length_1708_cov_55.051104_g1743_i0~~NODE_2038_length_1708_cov_55.051104_g1743_i0.p1  ORF type:complete len:461 (+),score=109.73 NODE_2038_length_1708_cov_55.051104_g1743_i0:236-1618(+)
MMKKHPTVQNRRSLINIVVESDGFKRASMNLHLKKHQLHKLNNKTHQKIKVDIPKENEKIVVDTDTQDTSQNYTHYSDQQYHRKQRKNYDEDHRPPRTYQQNEYYNKSKEYNDDNKFRRKQRPQEYNEQWDNANNHSREYTTNRSKYNERGNYQQNSRREQNDQGHQYNKSGKPELHTIHPQFPEGSNYPPPPTYKGHVNDIYKISQHAKQIDSKNSEAQPETKPDAHISQTQQDEPNSTAKGKRYSSRAPPPTNLSRKTITNPSSYQQPYIQQPQPQQQQQQQQQHHHHHHHQSQNYQRQTQLQHLPQQNIHHQQHNPQFETSQSEPNSNLNVKAKPFVPGTNRRKPVPAQTPLPPQVPQEMIYQNINSLNIPPPYSLQPQYQHVFPLNIDFSGPGTVHQFAGHGYEMMSQDPALVDMMGYGPNTQEVVMPHMHSMSITTQDMEDKMAFGMTQSMISQF